MRSESPAKAVVISLLTLAALLVGLLVYKIMKYVEPVEPTVSESVEVEQAASENGEVDDESYEEDITRDELHDLVKQYADSMDEEGAAEYLASSFGKVYPDEHYSLYNLTESFDNLVVYSNVPNHNWKDMTDWCATLYIDEDAASSADAGCDHTVVSDVIETTVDVLDCPVPTYVFPCDDAVVVRAAILPDVILEVVSKQTVNPDIGLENFKSALDIRLITD